MTKEHMDHIVDVVAAFEVSRLGVRGERVAVVRDPSIEKIGSIILATEAQRKESRGTIVAIGRSVGEDEDLHVGDRIMYTKYSPINFVINLVDGTKADVELFHVTDVYLVYAGDELAPCDG